MHDGLKRSTKPSVIDGRLYKYGESERAFEAELRAIPEDALSLVGWACPLTTKPSRRRIHFLKKVLRLSPQHRGEALECIAYEFDRLARNQNGDVIRPNQLINASRYGIAFLKRHPTHVNMREFVVLSLCDRILNNIHGCTFSVWQLRGCPVEGERWNGPQELVDMLLVHLARLIRHGRFSPIFVEVLRLALDCNWSAASRKRTDIAFRKALRGFVAEQPGTWSEAAKAAIRLLDECSSADPRRTAQRFLHGSITTQWVKTTAFA